jgi:glycerol-3-phosphate dehydrogenase
MPYLGEAGIRPYQDAARIAADPEYGRIACHCERVTRGEIRDALGSVLPPTDTGGLRRRTRAMNGRCQGFYCAATVTAMLAAARPGGGSTGKPGGETAGAAAAGEPA